ncbi:MAG: hypothetical protein WAM05_04810 [Candidatus Binataceae bacterium]
MRHIEADVGSSKTVPRTIAALAFSLSLLLTVFAHPVLAQSADNTQAKAPKLVLSPSEGVKFGKVIVGLTSAPQTVEVTNPSSTASITITSVVVSAPFFEVSDSDSCVGSIPASGTCQVDIAFKPTTTEKVKQKEGLTFTLSARKGPQHLELEGQGIGPTPASVSVAPGSVTAGLATALNFTFNSVNAKGSVSIEVPPSLGGPWSPPQASNPSLPGFVVANSGTCQSASVASASDGTMLIDFKCVGHRGTFQVVYGGGTAKANAATMAGNYSFTTLVNGAEVPVQPTVTVNPGPAARFTVTGLANVFAGVSQLGMVTAVDQYDNVATGYNGTVDFASSDPQTGVLSATTEMAADGLASFGVAFKTAGTQSVTATDSANPAITGMDTITVSPAGAARLAVTGLVSAMAGTPQTATATAYDIFGNVMAGYGGTVNFTTSDSQAVINPNSVMASLGVASALTSLRTSGPQSVTATDSVNPAITGTEDVTISAAQTASIQVVISPNPQPAYQWTDPFGGSAGAFLVDAYGNHVTSSDTCSGPRQTLWRIYR